MKYLRKFATKADKADLELPNVVLIGDTNEVLYNAIPNGVYIQHIDGKLYTLDAWTAKAFVNDEANGVAVLTDDCRFVMAKTDIGWYKWGGYEKTIEGIATSDKSGTAFGDCEGAKNTKKIIAQLSGTTDSAGISGAPAAKACVAYIFPNGTAGYLPAYGEWRRANSYRVQIDEAMSAIGGTPPVDSGDYWSSTQSTDIFAWMSRWGSVTTYTLNKSTSHVVRAFAPLNF